MESQEIIIKKRIVELSELRERYREELSKSKFANPNYRAEKLKSKLKKHEVIGKDIAFAALDDGGKFTSEIVFNKSMNLVYAIELAYRQEANDSVEEVASQLRRSILHAFRNSKKLPCRRAMGGDR